MKYRQLVEPGAGSKATAGMMINNFKASIRSYNPMEHILPKELLSYKI